MATKIERPCFQCEERMPPDCHAWCEKYLQSQEQKAQLTKERKEAKSKHGIVSGYVLENHKRQRKRKNIR